MNLPSRNWAKPSLARNVISYIVMMSLVPLITLGAISYWVSRSAVHERAKQYITEIMKEKKNYLNLLTRDVESLMLSLASQDDIRQVLQDDASDPNRGDDFKRLSTQAKIGYILSEFVNLDGILSIDLFSTGGMRYHVGETLVAGDIRKSVQEQLFSDAIESKRPVAWAGMVDSIMVSSNHPRVIAAVKAILALDAETGEEHPIGFLCVSYDPEVFNLKFRLTGQTGQTFRIVDQQYQILCDPDMRNIGKTLDPLLKNRMNRQSGQFQAEMDGEDTLFFYDRSEDTGWILMSFIQASRIDEQIGAISENTLLATGITAILAVLFIFHFSRRVVSPIRDITARFKEIQTGRPESELHLTAVSKDEIGELVRWFNTFLDNQAEKRRTEKELIQSQAELRRSHELLEKRVADRTQELNTVNLTLRKEITERKHAEEKVRTSNEDLQTLNHQLQENQQQLIQSEKMASIGQLVAGVAHEINNPIGFVKSNIGTLVAYIGFFKKLIVLQDQLISPLEAAATAECVAVLEQIRSLRKEEDLDFVMEDVNDLLTESIDGIQRVQDIILNLKCFARTGESKLAEADINEGIESTLKIVWNELKYKCQVHKNLKSLPRILCYPGQLNQVFINLLVNAAQAIPESGQIHISSESDGQSITVRIADTGAGIPPDIMSKIFDPFFTTKGIGNGTGLGLSISHGIIKKHGGTIAVESQVGKGTVFTIRLPVEGASTS